MLKTIGYEKADLDHFVGTLLEADICVLVDIRDRAQSRRRGFSKTALSEKLAEYGIEYIHLRALGDPKEGREAARGGDMKRFRKIYATVMETEGAKAALDKVASIARDRNACLLCYERSHKECHRKIVSDHLEGVLGQKAQHLGVQPIEPAIKQARRVLHSSEGAPA